MLDWKLNIGCIMTYQFFKYPQIYKNYQTYYPCFQKLLSFKNALNLIFYIFSMDLLNITWFIDLRKIDVELQKSTKIKIWKIKKWMICIWKAELQHSGFHRFIHWKIFYSLHKVFRTSHFAFSFLPNLKKY